MFEAVEGMLSPSTRDLEERLGDPETHADPRLAQAS